MSFGTTSSSRTPSTAQPSKRIAGTGVLSSSFAPTPASLSSTPRTSADISRCIAACSVGRTPPVSSRAALAERLRSAIPAIASSALAMTAARSSSRAEQMAFAAASTSPLASTPARSSLAAVIALATDATASAPTAPAAPSIAACASSRARSCSLAPGAMAPTRPMSVASVPNAATSWSADQLGAPGVGGSTERTSAKYSSAGACTAATSCSASSGKSERKDDAVPASSESKSVLVAATNACKLPASASAVPSPPPPAARARSISRFRWLARSRQARSLDSREDTYSLRSACTGCPIACSSSMYSAASPASSVSAAS
mmetsp:Transcript_1204/g.4748  ORF Transcript_1204/g.4748 Transcript_1204/m.4748 type:complete len:317 (-) Transcript_1204:757-1707(-)